MAVKLDMAKAFDRVEWDFLGYVMLRMGFEPIFVNWILQCIKTTSFSFNINGKASGYVVPSRGIRQGDPISPYLFLICSEIFSHLILKAAKAGEFQGLKISKKGPVVTHLLFADDSLVFCKATVQQASLLRQIIAKYGAGSGQEVNLDKSSVLFSKNITSESKEGIWAVLQGIKVQEKAKYLGLPLVIGRSKKEVFHYITDAVTKRVSNWKNTFLSTAGKEVLLKSVINALPVYTMSCFRIPKGVGKDIENSAAKFWWGSSSEQSKKLHWKSWSNMATDKEEGGLGFRNFQDFNLALLAKQLWRLITKPNLLMSKVMKGKYFPQGGLLHAQATSQSSWLWRSWISAKPLLFDGVRYQIGDGKSVRIWESPWISTTPNFLPETKKPDGCQLHWVSELMCAESHSWNVGLVQSLFSQKDSSAILQTPISQLGLHDKLVWQHTQQGQFTVASAYHRASQQRKTHPTAPESSHHRDSEKAMWKRLWGMKVKGKIKHFMWRLYHWIIPTNDRLLQKGIDVDPICRGCGEGPE